MYNLDQILNYKIKPISHHQGWLTHWGRVTHICVTKLTIIGSDNGLSPDRRQAIIWTNAGILLIGPLGTKFSEILIDIWIFSFKKMHLKMSSGKWRPSCLGLNVLSSEVSIVSNLRRIDHVLMRKHFNDKKPGSAFFSYWSRPCLTMKKKMRPGLKMSSTCVNTHCELLTFMNFSQFQ